MSGSSGHDDSLSSEYVDMERLDDEKMAELLLDEEEEDPDQPFVLESEAHSKQIIIKKPTGINLKKLKLLQADCTDSLDLQKLASSLESRPSNSKDTSLKINAKLKAMKINQKSNEKVLRPADPKEVDIL